MAAIFPSLISADLLNLQTSINQLEPHCAGFHIDIMDNHFVPNLTWGTMFVDAIAQKTSTTLWIHLMVDNPLSWITTMNAPQNSIISFHLESLYTNHTDTQILINTQEPSLIQNTLRLITLIQQKNWRASIAINPETPIAHLFPFLHALDHVLIMSVNPGRSGQLFIPTTDDKVTQLADYCAQNNLAVTISVDGGITCEHCKRLTALGVTHFAAAAAIFHTPDPVKALLQLSNI